jgi:uncharacterized protein (TIGR02246 family)
MSQRDTELPVGIAAYNPILRRTVRALIVALLVGATTSCSEPASEQMMEQVRKADAEGLLRGSMREEEDSIRAMWARFEEFYNKDDADGVVTLFEEDADRFTHQGEVGHGRAEIREQYVAEFAGRKADSTIQPFHAELTIRFLRPDVAILDAKAVWNPQTKVQFTVIESKASGRWLIAAGRPRGTLQP